MQATYGSSEKPVIFANFCHSERSEESLANICQKPPFSPLLGGNRLNFHQTNASARAMAVAHAKS